MSQGIATRRPATEVAVELSTTIGRLTRALSRGAPSDVPTATLRLLGQVEELQPVTIGALAAADRCSQPTMSNGVQHLVDRGWAVKVPNPADARSTLVSLTEAGRVELGTARRARAAEVLRRLDQDPDHDEADLAVAVAVLRGLLEQGPPTPLHLDDPETPEGTA